MKSDIQIAQEATLQPIAAVAEKLGLGAEEISLYGKYKPLVALLTTQKS